MFSSQDQGTDGVRVLVPGGRGSRITRLVASKLGHTKTKNQYMTVAPAECPLFYVRGTVDCEEPSKVSAGA